MSRGILPIILSGGLLDMNAAIPTTNILHIHYWTQTGQELDLENDNIVYVYRCSACGKVKRQ
jgi:hypothetical protein